MHFYQIDIFRLKKKCIFFNHFFTFNFIILAYANIHYLLSVSVASVAELFLTADPCFCACSFISDSQHQD